MAHIPIYKLAKKLKESAGEIVKAAETVTGEKLHHNSKISEEDARAVIRMKKNGHIKNGKKKKSNGRGRKELKLEVTAEVIKKYARIGLYKGDIAELHGMSERTFRRRLKENPDFDIAFKQGRAELKTLWSQKVYKKAIVEEIPRMLIYMGKSFFHLYERPEDNETDDSDLISQKVIEAIENFDNRGIQ